MDKESGKQFEVNLQSAINPWPTDPANEEPATPPVFRKTITVKISKKDKIAFKKLLKRQSKVPRKLKKALRHVGFFKGPMIHTRTENSISCKQAFWFGPKDGYPNTKWVRRACMMLKNRAILIRQREIVDFLPKNTYHG